MQTFLTDLELEIGEEDMLNALKRSSTIGLYQVLLHRSPNYGNRGRDRTSIMSVEMVSKMRAKRNCS